MNYPYNIYIAYIGSEKNEKKNISQNKLTRTYIVLYRLRDERFKLKTKFL